MAAFNVDFEALGNKIRQIRLAEGLTQEKLAEQVGISVKYMSHIETANGKCSMNVLLSLANVLKISIDLLFDNQLEVNKHRENDELIALINTELFSLNSKDKTYIHKTIKLIKEINNEYDSL